MYDDVRSVVRPKWSLEILTYLSEESPQNFSVIDDQFDTSSDVITDHLQLLVRYGLVARDERTRRDVRYSITDRGSHVLEQVIKLDRLLAND